MYMAVKHSHLMFVVLSLALFYYRFVQHKILAKELPKALKILPHIVDTLLLATAIALCFIIQQFPIQMTWLTFKVAFVIGYIVLAFRAMKATDKRSAIISMAGATICVVLAAKFAVTKGAF